MVYKLIIMRWKERTNRRSSLLDINFAGEIVYNAYREGYISWNIYNKALEKINTKKNGSWMFQQKPEDFLYKHEIQMLKKSKRTVN